MKALAFLCTLFCVSAAFAQQPFPADADDVSPVQVQASAEAAEDTTLRGVDKTKAYTLEFLADGSPVLTPTKVATAGPSPTPGPSPGPGPVLTDFSKAIKAAAEKATGDTKREETAEALAFVYRAVAKDARAAGDKTTPLKMATVNKQLTDAVMARQGTAATTAWQPTRDVLGSKLNAALEEGKTVAQFADLFDEAANGIEASITKKSINPDFLAFLKWLIETLLPLLLK